MEEKENESVCRKNKSQASFCLSIIKLKCKKQLLMKTNQNVELTSDDEYV